MAGSLLKRTRLLSNMLQSSISELKEPNNTFNIICGILRQILNANVYIICREGKLLNYALMEGFNCTLVDDYILRKNEFPNQYIDSVLSVTETQSNIVKGSTCAFSNDHKCIHNKNITTIIPIKGGGERLGTLILGRFEDMFLEDDLVLAEYSATVVGMEILRLKCQQKEEEIRKKTIVQVAASTLSYSEMEAIEHIFKELNGREGLLIASKLADKVGITRSVIVNALRKFESAGIIESRSLGMKGTYIKVLNDKLLDFLNSKTDKF
ncbi:MAG: GTP-sensing pleiotropic transcriptional regulator CodY [Mahellales bacterium]